MDRQALTKYLDAVWSVVSDANQYFAAEEPWAKKKTDPERMATTLYVTAELVRQFAILAQPVMPDACNKLLDLMAVPPDAALVRIAWGNRPLDRRHADPRTRGRVPALR